MAPQIADPQAHDAVLEAACAAARAAVAAYDAEAEKEMPGDALAALYDRERLALECVAATRARTPRGIARKAPLLSDCAMTPEAVGVAMLLAEDAVALVRNMASAGAPTA